VMSLKAGQPCWAKPAVHATQALNKNASNAGVFYGCCPSKATDLNLTNYKV
jgi:hypothetical protein